jgi:hypothetical protein
MPLAREDVHAIWKEVKANHARLDSCSGPHDFGPHVAALNVNYTCNKCGGSVNASARSWYEKGLAHGRKTC